MKPANLLLDENWSLVLADFGSAKKKISSTISSHSYISGKSGLSSISNISHMSGLSSISRSYLSISQLSNDSLEQEDSIVGTVFYVSPEMVKDNAYSFATDIWAFGVIVYQLFTGETPFNGETQDEIFEKIK